MEVETHHLANTTGIIVAGKIPQCMLKFMWKFDEKQDFAWS